MQSFHLASQKEVNAISKTIKTCIASISKPATSLETSIIFIQSTTCQVHPNMPGFGLNPGDADASARASEPSSSARTLSCLSLQLQKINITKIA